MQFRASRLWSIVGSLATLTLISATVAPRSARAWQQATELDDQNELSSVLFKRSKETADSQPAADNGDRAQTRVKLVPVSPLDSVEQPLEPVEQPLEPTPMAPDESSSASDTVIDARGPADSEKAQGADQQQNKTGQVVKAALAKFNGVEPGKSTSADVKKAWGEPVETIDVEDGVVYVYSVKPFDRIEMTLIDDRVASILIHLERPFDLVSLIGRLQLGDVEAVDVVSDEGDAMGQSFPERGVLFGFVRGVSPRQVLQILLEPIDPEPFVLRVKSHLHGPYARNLQDLKFANDLDPAHAESHWLRAKMLLAIGEVSLAEEAAAKAVALADNPIYRLTWAACVAQQGSHGRAVQETQAVLDIVDLPPAVKARGLLQMGDLVAQADARDYAAALRLHVEAIGVADPLALDRRVAVRRAAKEILVDAHLSVAHDIGWGNWRQKATVVPKWIDRAAAYAEEMIDNEEGSLELRLRVAERSLAALTGFTPSVDPAKWIDLAKVTADDLIDGSGDSLWAERIRWQLGMAYYHTLQIHRIRQKIEPSLKFARLAEKYLQLGAEHREVVPESERLVGRLCFQIGAIHAVGRQDHAEAINWYEKAVPRLDATVSNSAVISRRQQGEALVSMGVSYWQIGKREQAVALTEKGVQFVEQAVSNSAVDKSVLAIGYGNLAAMHEQLGNQQKSGEFSAMAKGSQGTSRR